MKHKAEIIESQQKPEFPKPKKLVIDGKEFGDITPELKRDGSLEWWAVIKMCSSCCDGLGLAQGRAHNPVDAVRNALVNYQKQIENSVNALADMQGKLGLTCQNENLCQN